MMAMADNTLSFAATVRARKSIRKFLPQPVADELLSAVLHDAQLTPSNSNTQPWHVHIVSCDKLKALSKALYEALMAGRISQDFSFDSKIFHGRYKERSDEQGSAYHESIGVARDDEAGRRAAGALNYSFFNAPHVALLF